MTIKEACLRVLEKQKRCLSYSEIYQEIVKNNLYNFKNAKTPESTISAQLGNFIREGDSRVKRVKIKGSYLYYLSKYEDEIDFDSLDSDTTTNKESFRERDLHTLFSTYLRSQNIYAKTIFHEKSKNKKNQKWVHPDIVGVKFLELKSKEANRLLKVINKKESFKLYSYELKKELKSDYDLKESFFQAVSNSSWANFGYLVAFEIRDNLLSELERLNNSFGIGVIKLEKNPFESKTLFLAKERSLDFKTIDKLSRINRDFGEFIGLIEKFLSANERFIGSVKSELINSVDEVLDSDKKIEEYCKRKNIN